MSRRRLLIGEDPSPEVPAHALQERVDGLRERGWDARLGNGLPSGRLRALGRGAAPVVHFTSGPAAVDGIASARRAGAPVLVSFSGEDLAASGLAEPGYYDDVWRATAAIHLSDERVWERALARGCPPGMARHVIAPATDPAFFSPPPNREDAPGPLRLLCVGPMRWSQGYEHVLHAVRMVADRGADCELRIAGSGDFAPAVAFARYQLGLEDRVTFTDPGDAAGLRDEYGRADVFVSAAVVEGTPRALLDAGAMALPAVVSDAGRDPGFMAGSALVVARRDPEALADALATLAADPALRREMGASARARAEKHTLAKQLDAFEALYDGPAAGP